MDSSPNILDLIFLVIAVILVVRAMMRGLIRELVGLAGLIAAVILAGLFYVPLADFLEHLSGYQAGWWQAVSFGLVLLVVMAGAAYLAMGLSKLIHSGPFSLLDRLLGGLVGLLKGVLACYLILNIILLLTPLATPQALKNSMLTPYVLRGGRMIMDLIPNDLTRTLQERSGILDNTSPKKETKAAK